MAREPFAVDEWYHCYSRGVDKKTVFTDASEYARFKHLLYICNSGTAIHRSAIANITDGELYALPRGTPLVSIGAYCLMPNHFHLLLREVREGGISQFMRTLGISYAMYFNTKHERVGNLFVKPFRAKRVTNDAYLRRVAQYIHLNPAELFAPGFKEGRVEDLGSLRTRLAEYEHSSLPDYYGNATGKGDRAEKAILNAEAFDLMREELPDERELLLEALLYYQETAR